MTSKTKTPLKPKRTFQHLCALFLRRPWTGIQSLIFTSPLPLFVLNQSRISVSDQTLQMNSPT